MTRLPADLLPARVEDLDPARHLPMLPAWFPLDRVPTEDDPAPAPYTDHERLRLRTRKALEEATRGPFDGQRVSVEFYGKEPPAVFSPSNAPHVHYRLDTVASTRWRLRYRYDPDSPIHPDLMRAVTETYAEHDQAYADLARQETTDERRAPNL